MTFEHDFVVVRLLSQVLFGQTLFPRWHGSLVVDLIFDLANLYKQDQSPSETHLRDAVAIQSTPPGRRTGLAPGIYHPYRVATQLRGGWPEAQKAPSHAFLCSASHCFDEYTARRY